MPTDVETASTMARVGSNLKTLTAIGKEALNALGIASTVVEASLIILDFINYIWVGGAIDAVDLVTNIITGALIVRLLS